jgi:outer membrane receptor protein involved in Fe transport
MKIRITFLLFFLIFSANYLVAQRVTLSGYVKDKKSGETLIGVSLFVKEINSGTVTNEYGFYSLSLPKGTYNVTVSYVGYNSMTESIDLQSNTTRNWEIEEDSKLLDEIVVRGEAENENVKAIEMSTNKLEIKTILKIPPLLGEVDIVRSVQLLPGVSTVGEGATGFNVRGGNIDQNLILLDEAPVYNSSHLFGFFSVFNPDAVKDLKLIKGGIPAQYGGRLSSILDVRMKEGNTKRFSGQGGIGLIFSRLTLEAPLIKDKASFIVAARRSYIDVLAKPFLTGDFKGAKFYFYDLTAKANYKINDRNTVFLSGYFGRDVFGAGFKFNWGNKTASLRWNHLFSEKVFMNLTAFYSNYDYLLGFGDSENQSFDWNSKIINYSVKPEFTFYPNPENTVRFGGQAILFDFQPGNAVVGSENGKVNISLDNKFALESGIYADNEQKIGERLTLQYGLRFSFFNYMGKGYAYTYADTTPGVRRPVLSERYYGQWENIKTYGNLEPRFSANLTLNESSSIKASYNRVSQYIHLLSNTAASTPLDVWTPSTNNIKPQIADQVALGYFRNFKDNMFETSVEVYYKNLQNQLDYINNADLLLNAYLEGDLLQGQGRAYGAEFYVRKAKGKFTGWISYTLARTERRVKGINNDDWFANRFDKPHVLNVVATYEVTSRLSLSGNFLFNSGTPATFATNRIQIQSWIVPHNPAESRSNFRIPPYHRLDLSATLEGKKKPGRRWESNWVFAVYNVYNRRNPFGVYFQQKSDGGESRTEAVKFSVIGSFVPSVSYNFKF